VLFDKAQTTLIKYPEGKEGTNYTVPDTVIDIEDAAFNNCKELVTITLPSGLLKLGSIMPMNIFSGCNRLEQFVIKNGNSGFMTIDGVLIDKYRKKLLFYPVGRKETEYAIPAGIECIYERAFRGCKYLKSVTFPESLKIIEGVAFIGCENLTSITLPPNLKVIRHAVFAGCKRLQKITLSRKTKIYEAYDDDSSVKFVYL
jgi:hypothetical protein